VVTTWAEDASIYASLLGEAIGESARWTGPGSTARAARSGPQTLDVSDREWNDILRTNLTGTDERHEGGSAAI